MMQPIKIWVSRELLAAMSTRDAEGNRLSVEIGEPDPDGFYTPRFTVHYDDNLLERFRPLLDERCHQLERFRPLLDERCHQDEKWGVQDHDDAAWLMILAEEVGEVAALVLPEMAAGDPYIPALQALLLTGQQAQALIQDACDLGYPQRENTPGVDKEATQITTVGLAWLECMARRRPPTSPAQATPSASPWELGRAADSACAESEEATE